MNEKYRSLSALIGKRLKNIRRLSGLTQNQFAQRVGITARHLSEIERGISGFTLPVLLAISDEFNIPTDYILLNEDDEGSSVSIVLK